MSSNPIRIISGNNIAGPSDPVRIANWTAFIAAVAAELNDGTYDGQFATLQVGDIDGGDYFQVEADGTWELNGAATTWRDEFGPLIGQRLESPGSDIVQNNAEGSLTFKASATLVDYVTLTIQLNHDWDIGAACEFHLHWWQVSANIPNWMIQWRWQVNGALKTAAWTSQRWTHHVFTYPGAGTFDQITELGPITPPVSAGLSDIVQVRLIRDTNNGSGLFAGADPEAANMDAVSSDMHRTSNTMGSRGEYTK